jgi:polysaccharide biosynthesis protein PslJ
MTDDKPTTLAEAPHERATVREDAGPRARRRRREILATTGVGLGLALSVAVLPPLVVGGAALALALLYLLRRWILTWSTMLIVLAAIIMFVPVRRYAFPIPLPFALEPYRVIIAGLLIAIAIALIGKRSLPRARVPFLWPIVAFLAALGFSTTINVVDLTQAELIAASLGGIVQMAFLLSLAWVVRQLLTSERMVYVLITFIVWAGVAVAFFAVVERITKVNVFLLLQNFLPLMLLRDESTSLRAGGARSYASSQHPIALAVLLCMIIPLAIYLAQYAPKPIHPISRKLAYGFAIAVLFAGMMTAVSRTGVVVLAVMFLLTLILRPRLALVLATVALPVALLGAALLPKIFDSMVLSFLDTDSLISSQYTSPGLRGQGRLADLGPAAAEFITSPFVGTGPGSRIVVGDAANSYILDNQVLGTLLEAGIVGLIGLAILMLAPPLILLSRSLRTAVEPRYALLGFAVAISMAGYVAAMFFYDAFSFIQTLMLLMVLFAIGGWLLDTHLARRPTPPTLTPPLVELRPGI